VLEIRMRNEHGRKICHPVGDLDAASSYVLRASLQELADEATPDADLVIDLSDVPFLDSAGLGAVISGVRAIRQKGGNVVLASPRPSVANLLRTTEIDQVVDVVGTDGQPGAVARRASSR
jgi:anti-sigma B factor antagonist